MGRVVVGDRVVLFGKVRFQKRRFGAAEHLSLNLVPEGRRVKGAATDSGHSGDAFGSSGPKNGGPAIFAELHFKAVSGFGGVAVGLEGALQHLHILRVKIHRDAQGTSGAQLAVAAVAYSHSLGIARSPVANPAAQTAAFMKVYCAHCALL